MDNWLLLLTTALTTVIAVFQSAVFVLLVEEYLSVRVHSETIRQRGFAIRGYQNKKFILRQERTDNY